MPRFNIYIRNENVPAWENSTRSDWINDRLASYEYDVKRVATTDMKPKELKVMAEAKKHVQKAPTLVNDVAAARAIAQLPGACPHGFEKNGWSCKKGCK